MTATYILKNRMFDDIRTTIACNPDGSSEVTQHHDGALPPGTRHYTPSQTEQLLSIWKDMAETMPTIWACEEAA